MIPAILILALSKTVHKEQAQHADPAHQVPRTILALYDSRHRDVRDTRIHRLLEMPLNHLGLIVRYCDLNSALPAPEKLPEVRGILIWFQSDSIARPNEFLTWTQQMIDAGKRLVALGNLSSVKDSYGRPLPIDLVNRFLAKLGLRAENWTPVTYDQRVIYKNHAVMEFERPLPVILPPFDRVRPIDSRIRSHLIVQQRSDATTRSSLVITGPHGGWVADGYTHFANFSQDQLQWCINPFEFLRLAFDTDEVPKLDTTTLNGRRIYYSQIDGDGWRNITEIPAYEGEKLSSAEVILKEAIEPFPDLPVTVAPIAGDLDPEWFGTRESLAVARRVFALPWVEAGSHTYSHPLDWESLGQNPQGQPAPTQTNNIARAVGWLEPSNWPALRRAIERYSRPDADEGGRPALRRGHSRLRSYELYPFDLKQEITGSTAFITSLLPQGKRVALLQWSGTTMVPEAALRLTEKAGLRNINGGDTRFDPEFNSYAWVAPLGRQAGELRQVYSSESNENTYTNLWNERYFGFRYLEATLRHTESPVRVKPIDVYYHMYSGQKRASLDAVIENLRYARSQEVAPVKASEYAAIVDGFHSATIRMLGPHRWSIAHRGQLDTVRFDHANAESVDFSRSAGVLGQRHYQGSLYVALDPAEPAPVIALAPNNPVASTRPYLVQSRWRISKFRGDARQFQFEACGFGHGEMEWQVAPGAEYTIEIASLNAPCEILHAVANRQGALRLNIERSAIESVWIRLVRTGSEK